MNLDGIAKHVREGKTLDASIAKELRRAVREGSINEIDRAISILSSRPAEARVSLADRELLEQVADQRVSTHNAALALGLLCNWLSLAEEEVPRILAAMTAPSDDDFLCIKACSCAALALAAIREPRLARALVEVYRDESRPIGTRESARDALLRVDGMGWPDIVALENSDARALERRAKIAADRLLQKT